MELHSTRFFEGDDHGGDAWQPLFLYYAPPLVHTPFQAPDEYIARCGGFDGYDDDDADAAVRKDTRAYCAMIVMFDESLANVSCAVDRLGWQDDTLLVVMTDNGGANNQISGSNFPLSGGKGNIWNGGMLGNAFISSPRLVPRGSGESHYVFAALAHMVDWLPTLMHAATDGAWDGTPLSGNALDGFDLWDAILGAVDASSALLPSPRTELAMMSDDSATLLYSDDGGVTLWKLNRDDSDPDYDRVLYSTYEVGSHEYTCSGVGVDDDHGAGDAVDDDDDDDDDDGHGPPPPGGGYDDDEGGSYGGGRQPRPCQPGGGYGYGGYGGGYGSKHYGSGGYGGGYGTGATAADTDPATTAADTARSITDRAATAADTEPAATAADTDPATTAADTARSITDPATTAADTDPAATATNTDPAATAADTDPAATATNTDPATTAETMERVTAAIASTRVARQRTCMATTARCTHCNRSGAGSTMTTTSARMKCAVAASAETTDTAAAATAKTTAGATAEAVNGAAADTEITTEATAMATAAIAMDIWTATAMATGAWFTDEATNFLAH